MSSGKDSAGNRLLRRREPEPVQRRKRGRKRGFPRPKDRLRPRVGIRVWLTALFVLVTAFAAVTSYLILEPRLSQALEEASQASFDRIGDDFETLLNRNANPEIEDIQSFAIERGLQWGIVRVNGDSTEIRSNDRGEPLGNLEDWDAGVVQRAVANQEAQRGEPSRVQSGPREGQRRFTYAVPVRVDDEPRYAVVFVEFQTESDRANADAAIRGIERVALLAGALALLFAGFVGYVVASLLSRRVSRLGVAAERLAAGNFDERIETRVEDEIGGLGATFNSMAASLQDAFDQVGHEKERGRAILDGMTDAVIGVDRELNAVFLNPRARELLESSDHEFHTRLQEILAKTRYAGPTTEPEVETGDRVIEVRAAPLEGGALAILRDVTEERRVQRAKAEFIANASHELKTPLFAISGNLEMLETEEDEEYRAGFLEEMRSQTERLQNLSRTLLDLSRLDANAVTFRVEELDVEELLHDLRRDFGYTGREINIRVAEEVPPVRTDPIQLHRTLAILLDNALKYSGSETPVDLRLSRENGRAVVSVADHGCGIPEAELPHIFDRFYRAQGSSRADGTGLGLALAHEITDHLGGELLVESRQNAGSTFSLSLPLAREPFASHREAREKERPRA